MTVFRNIEALINALNGYSSFAFLIAFLLLIISVFLFSKNRRHSLLFLFLGSVSIGLVFALIDPFLNLWDEKFHALVAKNLSDSPLKPHLLNNTVIDSDHRIWTNNYIWLHKPPLSLWQIALAIKIFGANVLAVRLPSILLHGLTTILTYKIGKIGFNARVGFYSAFVFALLNYPLELISGVHTADHIDVAFIFYITASIWAWMEYSKTKTLKWAVLLGVFVGLAVLTKWLVGLLVFSGWGVYLLVYRSDHGMKEWGHLLKSSVIAIIITAPWFFYTSFAFPNEFMHEMSYNSLHFTNAIEEHTGGYLFYWDNLKTVYGSGDLIAWIILLSVLFIWKTANERKYALVFYVWVLLVYLFFTLAQTKMNSFVTIVSPLILISVVALIVYLTDLIKSNLKYSINISITNVFISILLFLFLIRPNEILNNHDFKSQEGVDLRKNKIQTKSFIKNEIPGKKNDIYFFEEIFFYEYIDLMFYHPSIATNRLPTMDEIEKLTNLGYKIYVLNSSKKTETELINKSVTFIKKH
ncbi:MAG: glycosyltransferase family 39 protein [Brumimicrobium sp.]